MPLEFHFKKQVPGRRRIRIGTAEFYIIPLEMLLATRLERGLWKDKFDVGKLSGLYAKKIDEEAIFIDVNYSDAKKIVEAKKMYQKIKEEVKSGDSAYKKFTLIPE